MRSRSWVRLAAAGVLLAALPAFAFSSSRKEWVWVGEPDGAKSCEPGSGKGPSKGVERLKAAGIAVEESRKGSDGKMYAQMCGGKTGSMNLHRIPKDSLAVALQQGFQAVESPAEGH